MIEIQELYKTFKKTRKLDSNFCIVFVYNDIDDLENDLHLAEGITSNELSEIRNSFAFITDNLFLYKSEMDFVNEAVNLQKKFNYVIVYSMAQNTNGIGRRCFIPLVCEHFGFLNIGNDSYSSFLGGNKELMYKLLANTIASIIPTTHFIHKTQEIDCLFGKIKGRMNTIIIKPISESASIGVKKIDLNCFSMEKFKHLITDLLDQYNAVMIQEYIKGEEVEVAVLHFKDDYIATDAVEIIFPLGEEILDEKIILTENYDFSTFENDIGRKVKETAVHCAKILNFSAISRFDFRVRNGQMYLIDITPNPTISSMSSTAYILKKTLSESPRMELNPAFSLLVLMGIFKYGLFEPAFHSSI